MRRLVVLVAISLLVVPVLNAQNEVDNMLGDILEQWADQYEEESVPDDVVEQLNELIDSPINLNDTSNSVLSVLPFLTDYHRQAIRAYIAQYGEMVSLSELYMLNGFDSTTIKLLMPFVTVAPVDNESPLTFKDVINHGHSNLRFGAKTVRPLSRGYNEEKYAGGPYRSYFRYSFKFHDRISFQFSGDIDAGEAFRFVSAANSGGGVGQYGFDYYSYHLMFNRFGIVKRAIVGKYNLHFGQGVTLWSGSAPWMSGNTPFRRFGQGIAPASAFCEYGYLRGAAVTLDIVPKRLETTLFFSNVNRDATLSARDTSLTDELFFQSFYSSGYHRTSTELAKRGMLGETLFGAHMQYNGNNLQVGMTAVDTRLESEIVPAEYVYNAFAFNGKDIFNYGVDVTYRYRRMSFFLETAISSRRSRLQSDLLPVAGVGGFHFHLNADNAFSAAFHYGSPTFQNLHSNVIGQSGSAQNEEGVMFFCRTRLPGFVEINAMADFFKFPSMRYRIYSPSIGADYRLRISKPIARNLMLLCQYRYRSSQRNSDAQLYAVEDIVRNQLQFSLDYDVASWRLVSKVVYSSFECSDHNALDGFLMSQDIVYRLATSRRPLSIGTRLALFDIEGYDARIYSYESDLMYEFSVPMFTGRGVRLYALCRWEPTSSFSVAAKYAVTFYPDKESIGSAYELIEGNCRHEFKVQMRLKF